MKHLDLIINGKGGVGKSFFAVNFVQFLKDKGMAHVAIDSSADSRKIGRNSAWEMARQRLRLNRRDHAKVLSPSRTDRE